jgi:hypothetical protein
MPKEDQRRVQGYESISSRSWEEEFSLYPAPSSYFGEPSNRIFTMLFMSVIKNNVAPGSPFVVESLTDIFHT